jgi:hypothetical protein
VVPVDALRLAAGQIALSGTTDATARQLLDAFSAATIFSPAPARPGVVVLDFDGTNVVPVFSSRELLDEFTRATGSPRPAWICSTCCRPAYGSPSIRTAHTRCSSTRPPQNSNMQ